ncbi:GNAT family N-acetyltransferase [Aquimarina sp. 2201CG5-10]|uniref:GNAT family N-acetyltransferase n=1 Tax=Aquimarina callyspongiae TaxID=3098150 RepID=UPI002AB55EB0|nr:GNAT family N-acetyltransferase [Aquimarina sp. 2201CG5-10]MDY8135078.1 GNAT family N-acetyltransferase [Aquimarina sp. 2201CG5-10]
MSIPQLKFTIASSNNELEQIIQLQQKNLPVSISKSEKEKEGFVTVQHDFDILKRMNDQQPHIIAKDGEVVVGYTLCMTKDFGNEIPILRPMFDKINNFLDHSSTYITMGQVCIDKAYRKQGIFRGLYHHMREVLQNKYDVLITEVAANNTRSLNAHYAIGFKTLLTYSSDDIEWHIIHWNWE